MRFDWDDEKARTNLRDHHVSFDVAILAFEDPYHTVEFNNVKDGEVRFHSLGLVVGRIVLLVVYTVRYEDTPNEVIWIISARKADRREQREYEQNRAERDS